MKILAWVVRFVLFMLVLTFSIRNTDLITVQWRLGIEVKVQLVLALLIALLLGAVLAWVSLLPAWLRAKRIASVATKNAEYFERELLKIKAQSNQSALFDEQSVTALPVSVTHGV